MHIIPNVQGKVKEWAENDGLSHIRFVWASGEYVGPTPHHYMWSLKLS